MDLAVGVIIGGAFGKIVDSVVSDLIMPLVSKAFGGLDFSGYYFALAGQASGLPLVEAKKLGAVFAYGNFITVALNFAILAFISPGRAIPNRRRCVAAARNPRQPQKISAQPSPAQPSPAQPSPAQRSAAQLRPADRSAASPCAGPGSGCWRRLCPALPGPWPCRGPGWCGSRAAPGSRSRPAPPPGT